MGFFAEFSAWLNAILGTYIGDSTARYTRTSISRNQRMTRFTW